MHIFFKDFSKKWTAVYEEREKFGVILPMLTKKSKATNYMYFMVFVLYLGFKTKTLCTTIF